MAKNSACYCEKSVIANCDICGEKAHISPSTGLCIVCMTGDSSEDRMASFVLHELTCPLSDYVKKGGKK